jgi:hypothetical protein
MTRLKSNMVRTDEEILKQVRYQSLASAKGKRELEQAKQSIDDLFKQIVEIKDKAEKSERMVEEVCRDIKSLDYAKKNLTVSITTLKRLNMLVTGVSQLRTMAGKRRYKEVGSLLQAVTSLSACFDDFQHIPKIAESKKQFHELEEECSNLVYSEFEGLDHHAPTPAYFSDLCVVIEALGRTQRLHFMSWFVKDRLLDYEQTFKEGEEISRLENIKSRFQWLQRELSFYFEHFESTFPASWEMPQLLCEEFCLVSKEKLGKILEDMKINNNLSVRSLIDTMKATIFFEKELNKKFAGGKSSNMNEAMLSASNINTPKQDQEQLMAEQNAKLNPFSPEALKLKWKKFQEEKSQGQNASAGGGDMVPLAPCTRFNRIISDAFEPYLDIYVDFEAKEMETMMNRFNKQDSFEDRNMVFESSQVMFDQFKEVMDTCTSLSRGYAFLKISHLFREQLKIYSDFILGKLPRSLDGPVKLKEGDEKIICFVINTAEYCTSNVEALSETIKQHLDQEYLGKFVEFASEQDRFQTVVARGMLSLVKALETKIVLTAFAKMQKQNWTELDHVVVESGYVALIDQQIRETVVIYHKFLSKSRFNFFCDNFSNSFIPKYKESILQLKSVDDVGAEQLLLDVAHVKSILDGMPKQGNVDRVPSRYKRIVQKEISKLERLLKVMLTPKDGLVVMSTYLEMMGAKANTAELSKVLDLKGILKKEQTAILDAFLIDKHRYEQEKKMKEKSTKEKAGGE